MGNKYKRTVVFKSTEDGKVDFSDLRLLRFMMVPLQWESLMTFGKLTNRGAPAFGIGLVSKVVKTDKGYDVVYMNFGKFDRPVIVWEYNARKQLVTLSRNKYAMFYGFVRNAKTEKRNRLVIYARALQGWYVPTQFDIQKKYKEFEFDQENEQDVEFKEFMEDIMEIKDE